jgi:hypothetical protein
VNAGKWEGNYGEVYEYDESRKLTRLLEEAKSTEVLDFLPMFLFNNDLEDKNETIDNTKNFDKYGNIPYLFNQSDYVDLAELIEEINDRNSQISVEFIKNLTSKMSLPKSFIEAENLKKKKEEMQREKQETPNTKPNGRYENSLADNPDFYIHEDGETPAQYITKDSSLLQIAINNRLDQLIRYISAVSAVPVSSLGGDMTRRTSPVGTTEKEREDFYDRVA